MSGLLPIPSGPRPREVAEFPITPAERVEASRDTIVTWAAFNGLKASGLRLADVNALRRQLGLPLFRLLPDRGRQEPLPKPHIGGSIPRRNTKESRP